jgi:ribonuclease J
MMASNNNGATELVFLPLGGIGEIGMNAYLYGLGDAASRSWLLVDLGVTFPDDREPGVDIVLPDIRFIEEERSRLAGILLTHAHEDHFGAVAELWPRLRVPVHGTRFTIAFLKEKLSEYPWGNEVPLVELPVGGRFTIGPFDIELVSMSHSIPETNAVAIRAAGGMVLHSADWKLDPAPGAGPATDTDKLRRLGDEGVDVLVCDSTNVLSEGFSESEADVATSLRKLIFEARGRVAITSFSSSVARLLAVAHATEAAHRHLVLVGRSMVRMVDIARETGLWPDSLKTFGEDDFAHLPQETVVALLTGSQGEPRAALARIADNQHPRVKLGKGDQVIFSTRTIPGNENAVIRIQNKLADMGVAVLIEWAEGPIHASGHPRRGELAKLYDWVRPKTVIPMHGEPRHLEAHVTFARARGLGAVQGVRNGKVVRLLPGPAEIIDEAPVGRVYRDGHLMIADDDDSIRQRRKLSFVGSVVVAVVMRSNGELATTPKAAFSGVPEHDEDGQSFDDIAEKAAIGAIESIPRARRKDPDLVSEAVRKSVRAAIGEAWGKRPICTVLLSIV